MSSLILQPLTHEAPEVLSHDSLLHNLLSLELSSESSIDSSKLEKFTTPLLIETHLYIVKKFPSQKESTYARSIHKELIKRIFSDDKIESSMNNFLKSRSVEDLKLLRLFMAENECEETGRHFAELLMSTILERYASKNSQSQDPIWKKFP